MLIKTKTLSASILAALVFPGMALAAVQLPAAKPGLPPQTSAPAATQYAVPAVATPAGQPTAKTETSTEIWQKAIATPPEGMMQARSRQAMQKALVEAYEAGKLQTLPPIVGTNGEILYAYGNSFPTLVTAPLHTSVIELQPGSHPTMATGLPKSEWSVHAIMAGNQPELTVSPLFKGLHADLVIPATSSHGKPMNYVIEVTSDAAKYTPIIGFYYPNDDVEHWKQQAQTIEAANQKAQAETVAELPSLTAQDLNFGWKIRCGGGGWFSTSDCGSIKPERVFDDGTHTYIQFRKGQSSHGGIPSIMAENSEGKPAILNAQYRDQYYIVDSVPNTILLIEGKGENAREVKITKDRRSDCNCNIG